MFGYTGPRKKVLTNFSEIRVNSIFSYVFGEKFRRRVDKTFIISLITDSRSIVGFANNDLN
jgi:hypothetical protein